MATRNPFLNAPEKAEIWELGYVAGFAEPEVDHFLPLSTGLVEAYQAGEQSGRDDRRLLPPGGEQGPAGGEQGPQGHGWAEIVAEIGESVTIHALGEGLTHLGIKAGGLISLVLEVIQIPGDMSLTTLEPEWEGPVDQEHDTYVTMCGRTDHAMELTGAVTDDGYWMGPERQSFRDAAADKRAHQHTESAIVVRCSVADGTCGPVWPVR